MKRYSIIFIFLILACDTPSSIKPPDKNYFVKYFGGEGNQQAVGLIVNADGTFFILGNSRTSISASQQVYLAKADARGNLIWQTTYGKNNTEMTAQDFALTNGTLVVVANKLSTSTNNVDVQLIRFTMTGDTIQSAVLQIDPQLSPTPKNEWAKSLTVLNDGGFLVSGYTDYVGATTHQQLAMHLRTDINFKQRLTSNAWIPASGQGNFNLAAKGFQTLRDTIYFFGSTDGPSPPSFDLDLWGFGLNSKAQPIGASSSSTYVVNGSDETMTSVIKATLGGYLLTGVLVDKTNQNLSLKVIKIRFDDLKFGPNPIDDIQFSYLNSLPEKGPVHYATACNSGSGYFVLANSYNTAGTSDMILLKLDVTLQKAWDNPVTLGGDGEDTAAAVAELPDGHIMVLGTIQLGNPPEQFKIALMKLNSAGGLSD
ncbi:MAG: hypothetical protein HYR67_13175 [Bacteroidetes bacterium]|nr:hypothetical protein [Bacteroidota bacterium]